LNRGGGSAELLSLRFTIGEANKASAPEQRSSADRDQNENRHRAPCQSRKRFHRDFSPSVLQKIERHHLAADQALPYSSALTPTLQLCFRRKVIS
jgi:hypothetical protein